MPSPTPDPGGWISAPPDPSGLPGSDQILVILGGVRWAALAACLIALVIGAATWAFSSHQGNPYWASRAKVGVLGAVVGLRVSLGLSAALMCAGTAIVALYLAIGMRRARRESVHAQNVVT